MPHNKQPRLHQSWIDSHALGIVKALQKRDFETYLVGGCVRDLLLGIEPKDFDIATTAHPEDVKKIIHKSYIIGKRFRLVLVKRDDQQFEVATFRKDIKDYKGDEENIPTGDNLFGTAEEDAKRRDFTINGLFYDPVGNQLLDYPGGLPDLESGVIRMIGDPTERLIEDPIRILRALRLAHKIDFTIDSDLKAAMKAQAKTLFDAALPRKREEFLKLLRLNDPALPFIEAYDLDILKFAAPTLNKVYESEESLEIFTRYMQAAHDKALDRNSPVELFGILVLAFVRARISNDSEKPLKSKDLLEHSELSTLMKDELGMFKYEQSLVTKAIQLQATLARRLDFERKGERRQMAVLNNESLPLAMKIAGRDFTLSTDDWHFWLNRYWEALPKILSLRESEKTQRRGTRRRRPRRPRDSENRSNGPAKKSIDS